MNVEIRELTKDNWDAVLELYKDFSDRDYNRQQWLYTDNPSGESILLGLYVNNELVGTRGLIPYILIKNGIELHTYKGEDGFIRKSHRGQGYFGHMNRKLSEDKNNIIWGFSHSANVYKMDGFNHESQILSGYYRRTNFLKILSNKSLSLKKKLALIAINKFNFKPRRLKNKYNIIEGFSNNVEQFYSNISQQAKYYIPKMTREIYQWQYENNPLLDTTCISIVNEGEILCTSFFTFQNSEALMNSIYFSNDISENEKSRLIKNICNHVLKKDISHISYWFFNNGNLGKSYQELFKNANFAILNKGMYFGNNLPLNNTSIEDIYLSGQFKVIN